MRASLAAAVISVGTLAKATTAHAQAEEVTVRGTQSGDFSGRADERDSARELTDAASLVEPLPGVHMRRFGADDSFTTLSIRGSSSSELAILLAGVPLTGGADPSLDLSTLPLWPGAVAHVHRSFAPASLGPGSLGGTLVLDPPRPTSPEATDVWAAAGSFGAARLRVGDVRDAGRVRIATALSASRADDDFSYFDALASTPGHDVFDARRNAAHDAVSGLVSWAVPVRWTDAAEGALTVTTLAQGRRQELPGTTLGPTPFAELDSNRELASAELSGSAGPGAWSARAWGRREGTSLHDVPGSAALGPTRADDGITAAGWSMGWRGRPMSNATLEVRVDGSSEHFAPGLYEGATTPPTASRASAGAALDADWRPTEAVTMAASGRVDGWSDASTGGPTDGELRPTGHVGIEATLDDTTTLTAHAGSTARPPSFVERYGDRGAFIGDPTLLPESAWTIDAGARTVRRFAATRVALELVGFATWADDLITFVPVGAFGRAKATNIGRSQLVGVEADVRAAAGPFELRAAYTGLATANESACTAATGGCERPPLPARPRSDLVADAIARFGPATLRAGVDDVSGMAADLTGSVVVPARVLASAGARLDVAPNVRLAVDVRNVFDVRTGTYAGALGPVREPIGDFYEYPLPGRSVLVSARFTEPPMGAR